MTIKINLKKSTLKNTSSNLVLFVDEKFSTNPLKKYISSSEFSYITDILKSCDLTKNLFVFELSSKKKIVLVSVKKNIKISDIENLGAEFYGRINYGKNSEYFINSDSIAVNQKYFIKQLRLNRKYDSIVGGCKIGPHKSDYIFHINNKFFNNCRENCRS